LLVPAPVPFAHYPSLGRKLKKPQDLAHPPALNLMKGGRGLGFRVLWGWNLCPVIF